MAPPVGLIPPPTGVTPNFSGNRTKLQSQIVVIYAAMTTLSTFALGLRLYTRFFIRGMAGLDDLLIVLSWIGCIAWLVLGYEAFQFGFGQHIWNVTAEQATGYSRMLVGIIVVYVWTPALTKISLLTLFHRLDPHPKTRGCTYALAFLVFSYSLVISVTATGPCSPVKKMDPKCLTDVNLFMSIVNIATDLLILLLPLPMLYRLELPRKQKILLGLIFTLGSGVVVISIVRITYIYHWISNPDFTYYQAMACIFSCAELNGGVTCASSALLKPFFERYWPRILSLSSGSKSESETRRLKFLERKKFGRNNKMRDAEGNTTEESDRNKCGVQVALAKENKLHEGKRRTEVGESTEDLWSDSRNWNNN